MPVNFQALSPIQSGQIIAQLPQEQQSSGGGIGGVLKGLAGIAGGFSKSAIPPSANSGSAVTTPYTNPISSGTAAPIAGLQGQQSGGFNTPYMSLAKQFLGTSEGQGAQTLSGFFQKSLGQNVDPRSTPWCGAFAGSVLKANGQEIPNNPLAARSYLNFGQPVQQPSIGDVVVLSRGNDGVSGHVGFYNGTDSQGRPTMLAGNQGNAVSISPYDPSRVLGYRTPPTVQELQSKPSPKVMTQQATARAQNDPQYARKVSQEMNMVPQNSQVSNMSSQVSQDPQNPLAIPNVIKASQTVYSDNPVMAAVAASQAILESRLNGTPSGLAKQNNLFGIKGSGTAGSVNMDTKEFQGGRMVGQKAGFAKNATLEDSYTQHRNLMSKPRYEAVRNAKNIDEALDALQNSGYATDPNYKTMLKQIYEKYVAPNMSMSSNSAPSSLQNLQPQTNSPQMAMQSRSNPQVPQMPPQDINTRDLSPEQIDQVMKRSAIAGNGIDWQQLQSPWQQKEQA